MSQLDEKMVRHVAHLARLQLSDSEVAQFGRELSRILDYMEQLNEVDTEGVEPTAHPMPLQNVLRDDEPRRFDAIDAALDQAPVRELDFFLVPRVLDQRDGGEA